MILTNLGRVVFIKIVMLTPYYYPVIGGITTFVGKLLHSLSDMGNSVSVIAGEGESAIDVDVVGLRKVPFIFRVFMLLRRQKPEVVHSHAHWYILIPSAIYKILHPGAVLVHTFHTDPVKRIRGIKRIVFQMLISKYDHLTFVSRALMDAYEKDFGIGIKSGSVVYAGVSIDEAEPGEKRDFIESHKLDGKYPILCFVGPLAWKRKVEGVKRLISAFEIVQKTLPSSRLLIVGDGEFRKELEEMVHDLRLENHVIFTGFLQKTQVPLSVSDIYTHITLQEGQSIALLEAMRLGRPIIASRTGGIPEAVKDGENGLLVESDPETIAHEILELCQDRERMKALGRGARRIASRDFTWERASEKFTDIYRGETS